MGCGGSSLPNQPDARPTRLDGLRDDTHSERKEDPSYESEAIVRNGKPGSDPEAEICIEELSTDVSHTKMPENFQPKVTESDNVEKIRSSLHPGELFCDLDFPANDLMITGSIEEENPFGEVVWKRPHELVAAPSLLVGGAGRNDIAQGLLGDCWFLSSCAVVSQQEGFVRKIIPPNQPLYGPDYQGFVAFRFWRYGEWITVVVDDRLPTQDGQLIFAHCIDPNEFWISLLEKAYAKLHYSYGALGGGQTMDALVDLTGGLAERYEMTTVDYNMYRLIQRAFRSGGFIACSRKGNWRDATHADKNGLVAGHAYSITDIRRVRHKKGEERLVRIRNPWGDGTEWKGSWSDTDTNWKWVDDETKAQMKVEAKSDGEFWMSYKDFCKHFSEVTICTVGPDFDGDGIPDKVGCFRMTSGKWLSSVSAGGCRNEIKSFATNPQFLIHLKKPDDFDPMTDDPETEGKCNIVIALMQDHRESKQKIELFQIGFVLYKIKDPSKRLPPRHFRYNYDAGKSGVYINYREVSNRFDLDPGHYVIIPSTFSPNECASFIIRVFGQGDFDICSL